MKNYVQPGENIEFTAPDDVVSGQAVLIGNVIGVATKDAAAGERLNFLMRGVVEVTKTGSQAWAEGQLVYFDGAVFTSSGGFLAGFATEAVGSGAGETTGKIYLDGIPKDDAT